MYVFDGASDTDENPVGVAAADVDVEAGRDAVAKLLSITVAMEVAPGGVMVSVSANMATTPDVRE